MVLPASAKPVIEERNLLRQVPCPDDEQLRERKVRPQHHEREQQFSEIEEMQPRVEIRRQRFDVAQRGQDQNDERESRQPLASDEKESENRRIPVRVERHDPVDRRKRHRDDVDEQARCADDAESNRVSGMHRQLAAILRVRPGIQQPGAHRPQREKQNRRVR